MDVTEVANQQSQSLKNASTGLAENYDTFLQLLTQQMQNQDPLNPMDSTQFVSQLVEFSSVEQQIAQNKNLETLIGLQYGSAYGAAANYLGRTATAVTDAASLSNGQAQWNYRMPEGAEKATLVVTDQEGKEVYRTEGETGKGLQSFTWDGKNASGADMPDGLYKLEVRAENAEGKTLEVMTEITGQVTGVDFTGQEPAVLIGDQRVPIGVIKELRQTASPSDEETPAA